MKIKSKFFSLVVSCLIFISLCFLAESCADNPNSIGKNFLNPNDTLGVQIFDSFKDTMQISSINIRRYVNTSNSPSLMVGKNPSYISKGLIKFNSLSASYDTSQVVSATLKLKYRNYYFPVTTSDSLGQIAFDIKPIIQSMDFTKITYDSAFDSYFGTGSVGSYSGSPSHDTTEIDIPLDTALVHNWFKNAADTSNPVKNYGIVLYPNAGSSTLKAFYSGTNGSGFRPVLNVIAKKYNSSTFDTLNYDNSSTAFVASTSFGETPEVFRLLGGVGYADIMRFNISKLPSNIIVNDVQVILTIDPTRSMFSNQTNYNLQAYYMDDSMNTPEINSNYYALSNNQVIINSGQNKTVSPISFFQKWIQGQSNYGMMIQTFNQNSSLDLFTVYNETASDPTKRPHVIIKYSLRIPK